MPLRRQREVVALELTGIGEGCDYSQPQLLRARYKLPGEVRTTGRVKQDQIYLMTRAGIDAFRALAHREA